MSDIKLLVLDVDGVMTDGGMYYTEKGDEFKRFNSKDGIGIRKALAAGIKLGIISNSINDNIINQRAQRLGIEYVYVGSESKLPKLKEWCDKLQIGLENVAYAGDDLPDLEIMKVVGLSACPADAVDEVKAIAKIQLDKKGGEGCVREFIDKHLL